MRYFDELNLIFALLVTSVSCAGHWSYNDPKTSPRNWADLGYPMCNGVRQSPIPLSYGQSTYNSSLTPVTVIQAGNFAESEKFTLENNGHTLEVSLPSCQYFLHLYDGGRNPFCVKQFHFHWGANSSVGSEHSINGKFFSLEMHIVAYNTKYYNDSTTATTGVDGLAVLSLLFQEDSNVRFEDTLFYNLGLNPQEVNKVDKPDTSIELNPFSVDALLNIGSANQRFFRYAGSLTTPPCTENVYWTVIAQAFPVTPDLLKSLRNLEYPSTGSSTVSSREGSKMVNNFRNLQEINPADVVVPRVVYRSWNSAQRSKLSSLILLAVSMKILLF